MNTIEEEDLDIWDDETKEEPHQNTWVKLFQWWVLSVFAVLGLITAMTVIFVIVASFVIVGAMAGVYTALVWG